MSAALQVRVKVWIVHEAPATIMFRSGSATGAAIAAELIRAVRMTEENCILDM